MANKVEPNRDRAKELEPKQVDSDEASLRLSLSLIGIETESEWSLNHSSAGAGRLHIAEYGVF